MQKALIKGHPLQSFNKSTLTAEGKVSCPQDINV